ncbi:ferredoxin [Streptomyces diacarni]|uniref:Ferredoxin n=1 Tax=Streptomyces diacarni TaxID=2800381 RepID=A0A367F534_9ACTN|nr:ferredoxin [Streptomyces diacarni]RCG24845.1 ferredoxin [Streptomyces diacarni]
MAVRSDSRFLDAPLVPVSCRVCGAGVRVRKSTWDQTSVQWDGEALASCTERRASGPGPGPSGEVFRGCGALAEAIREAAVLGEVRVRSEDG